MLLPPGGYEDGHRQAGSPHTIPRGYPIVTKITQDLPDCSFGDTPEFREVAGWETIRESRVPWP